MGDAAQCPFGDKPHGKSPAHTHPYKPPGDLTKQCTCGSRQWLVSITPGLPLAVICARIGRCTRTNRLATAFERGREAGPRVRESERVTPPF